MIPHTYPLTFLVDNFYSGIFLVGIMIEGKGMTMVSKRREMRCNDNSLS